jgi:hypothetical protein
MVNNIILSNQEQKQLYSTESPYTLTLRREDFENQKDFEKFSKKCERLIRVSPEYSEWTQYLREVLGFYSCNITGESNFQTTVEIHHHPFTLYDVVKCVIKEYLNGHKSFCSFDICRDVIELHYENIIGYIPLISSLHEKYHNGFLLIPMELVHGDYKIFYERYHSYFDDDDIADIQSKLSIGFENCGWKQYSWAKDNYSVVNYEINKT